MVQEDLSAAFDGPTQLCNFKVANIPKVRIPLLAKYVYVARDLVPVSSGSQCTYAQQS